jgi:hypothetical protein
LENNSRLAESRCSLLPYRSRLAGYGETSGRSRCQDHASCPRSVRECRHAQSGKTDIRSESGSCPIADPTTNCRPSTPPRGIPPRSNKPVPCFPAPDRRLVRSRKNSPYYSTRPKRNHRSKEPLCSLYQVARLEEVQIRRSPPPTQPLVPPESRRDWVDLAGRDSKARHRSRTGLYSA